ncbi:MAG: hypothetical protein AAF989_17275, partial [Planctomycetota bacterium]
MRPDEHEALSPFTDDATRFPVAGKSVRTLHLGVTVVVGGVLAALPFRHSQSPLADPDQHSLAGVSEANRQAPPTSVFSS